MELTNQEIEAIERGCDDGDGFCINGEWYVPERLLDEANDKVAALEFELKQKEGMVKNMANNAAQQKGRFDTRLRDVERRERALAESADESLKVKIKGLEASRDGYRDRLFELHRTLRRMRDEIDAELRR